MSKEGKDFDTWFEDLKEYGKAIKYTIDDNQKDSWKDYFLEGYTPQDAIYEDVSYG